MPNYNLTGQKIKDTYSQLAQVSASTLVDGLGVAAPITTASITNFPTEVSRSAAAAGFGAGTSGGVSEATFTAYTASNDAVVATKLGTAVFTAYTASNDAVVATKLATSVFNIYTSSAQASVSALTTRVNTLESVTSSYALKTDISGAFTSLSSSLSTRLTNDETSITSLNSATSSYALKTAISGAFTLPSGVVSSSAQINLAQAAGTASYALTASYVAGATSAFPYTGSANIQGKINLNNGGALIISDWTGSLGSTSVLIGVTNNVPTLINVSGSKNVQIGYNNRIVESNTRDNCVVIGADNSVAQNSIAIGSNIEANVDGALAIGNVSKAYGNYAIALGPVAYASGDSSISIGRGAEANAGNAIAIGYDAGAPSQDSIAIGRLATTSAIGAIALGYNVTAAVQSYTTTNYLQLISVSSSMGQYGYADDSAAGTAGVPLGGVYHTSGSLKIRMV